jgi:formylglycine-generating enzyme required for sulfatase activity
MILTAAVAACYAVVAQADVFNMGPGLTSLETVQVGNPGNAGEWSGWSYGGGGPDRICGAVDYAYNIGKYEVTAGQYTEFLNAVGSTDTYALYNTNMSSITLGSGITRSGSSGSYSYSVNSASTDRPVNYVSWGDAMRFANWLHNGQPAGAQDLSSTENGAYYLNGATTGVDLQAVNREADWKWAVTSEDEWYKAAYHDKAAGLAATYFDYPTSNNSVPGQDMTDVSENNANHYTSPYVWPIDSGKYTTVVGEFQDSDSPYGTFDQGGNVWEWNESILYSSSRGMRGGSFGDGGSYGLLASFRSDYDPTGETANMGFRVASVPEPGSLAMLLGLALSALWYGWRRRG